MCLLAVSISATSKMFDLGNYTIDTGAYSLPSDARVSGPETLEWSWNESEKTIIKLDTDTIGPKHPELLEINNENYSAFYVKNMLVDLYSGFEAINSTYASADEFEKTFKSLNAVLVQRPYSGYIVILAHHPTVKIYVGVIDRYHYLIIVSTESDEMLALIMRELKVYPKDKSDATRLQAIQKML